MTTIHITGTSNDSNLILSSDGANIDLTADIVADVTDDATGHDCSGNCGSVTSNQMELLFKYTKALVMNDKVYNNNLLLGTTAKLYTQQLEFKGVYSADTSGANVSVSPSSNMTVNKVVGACLQQLGNITIPDNLHNCPGAVSVYLWLVSPVFGGPCLKNGKLTAESPNFIKLMKAHSDLYKYEINVGRNAYNMPYLASNGLSWYPYPKITNDAGDVLLDGFEASGNFFQYANHENAPTQEQIKKIWTDSWDAIESLIVEQSFTAHEAAMLRASQYLPYYHCAVLSMGTTNTYVYQKSKDGPWLNTVNKDISCTDYVANREEFTNVLYKTNTQFGTNSRDAMLWYNKGFYNDARPSVTVSDGVATTFKALMLPTGGPQGRARIEPFFQEWNESSPTPITAAGDTFNCC